VSAASPASIHARLLNLARARGEDFNLVLVRYATERFLYRLSQLPARESYWLKGAMLFDLWFDVAHRPTRDADFLGFGPMESGVLASTVREICAVPAKDGMRFDADSIVIDEIREDARYGGLRVRGFGAGKGKVMSGHPGVSACEQRRRSRGHPVTAPTRAVPGASG
jgi:hypothetical protein